MGMHDQIEAHIQSMVYDRLEVGMYGIRAMMSI